jgi:hypothetical protein
LLRSEGSPSLSTEASTSSVHSRQSTRGMPGLGQVSPFYEGHGTAVADPARGGEVEAAALESLALVLRHVTSSRIRRREVQTK